MTICARCGRCSRRRRGRFSAPSIGRARSASSICGSRREPVPVGAVEQRRGWVVVACLGYSRAGAGALIFSKETPDLLWGIARCLWSLGGAAGHAGLGPPGRHCTPAAGGRRERVRRALRPAAGRLAVLRAGAIRRPRASSSACRATWRPTSSAAGRFANERDYQLQLDAWFAKANARTHKTLRCRPVDRLAAEREQMAPLPAFPDLDRRWVTRVPADPYLRFDTNDYSLDPRAGRPARRGPRLADRGHRGRLDTGELAARHTRSFARHRTITAIEHARALRELPRPTRRADRRRDAAAGRLRRADRMSTSIELTHLFRALKAPAAARALPKLADRARAEEWSYERFAAGAAVDRARLAARRTAARAASRPPASPPARRSRSSTSPSSARVKKTLIQHLGQLDFLARPRERRPARPARHRQDPPLASRSGSAPAWPATASRSAPPPNGSRCSPTPNAKAASTTSSPGCSGSRC